MPDNTNTRTHSILSPSSSSIWLNCTPSALMSELMPEVESEYTDEGTNAHKLAEFKVQSLVAGNSEAEDPRADSEFADKVSSEMETCTDSYAQCISQFVGIAEEDGYAADVHTEIRLDLSFCIPEGTGTADCVIIAGDTLRIVDFKYGAFHKVDGRRNTQMMIYALGAANHFREYGPFAKVMMTVFQPRMDNVFTDTISMRELENWKNTVLVPKARLAIAGEGELAKGSHCDFCRAKLLCRLYRSEMVENIKKVRNMYDITLNSLSREEARLKKDDKLAAMANMLSVDEIADALIIGEGMSDWLKNIREHAKTMALAGTKIPGFKLIEKAGSDILTDDAAAVVKSYGIDPHKPEEYKSKTALLADFKKLEGVNGPAVFNDEVFPLMDKTPATPSLVKEDAKGEEKTAEYFAQKAAEAKAAEEAQATADTIIAAFA